MKPIPVCIETSVPHEKVIVSHTNLDGVIVYVNETFAEISGYETHELKGQPHNIVRHPDMPSSIFADLWKTLPTGKIWSGYIKNLRKDGGYYWVHAEVSRLFDKKGQLIGYKSLRTPVEKIKRNQLEQHYAHLKEKEENLIKLNEWIDRETYLRVQHLAQENKCSVAKIIDTLVTMPYNA